jgi:hypothetical protein
VRLECGSLFENLGLICTVVEFLSVVNSQAILLRDDNDNKKAMNACGWAGGWALGALVGCS